MPGNEDLFQKAMNEGHSAAWDQEWNKAASAYRKALQEMPDQPKALNSLGLALFQLGEFDEAINTYKRAAQISLQDPVPMEKLAQLFERTGRLKEGVEAASRAAELFLNQRDVDKAIENWARIVTLEPEHLTAHSRLALAYERLGRKSQAVAEYINVASLVQRTGDLQKTDSIIQRALQIHPESAEAKQAQTLLRAGQLLPKPLRPKGGTGPIAMAQIKRLDSGKKESDSGLDPIAEARQSALTQLAELLFEYTSDDNTTQQRRGFQALVHGAGQLTLNQSDQTKAVLHIGQAIDAQTKGNDAQAANELEHAFEARFDHPALHFDLGLIRAAENRYESALRQLQHAIKHNNFALGARLLMGQVNQKMGRFAPASIEYLEALKIADAAVAPSEHTDEIRQMYEPLIEAQASVTDDAELKRLCDNINTMLMRPHWRDHLYKAREEMQRSQENDLPMPLAEMIMQAQSSAALDAIHRVHQLARAGQLRTAMEEAYYALSSAPTYLPLHILMGDLLVRENHQPEAIAKFTAIAQAYNARGDTAQSSKILRRITQLAPMDTSARKQLIDQLILRGETDNAIREYIELADIFRRLADLALARKTYATALRLAQQSNADRAWSINLLQNMADIDMQRLDWKQAIRVYEQIRTLRPDDEDIRRNLIDLNLKLGQPAQANVEVESYLSHLQSSNRGAQAIAFLEGLLADRPDESVLKRALASAYQHAGRIEDAVLQLDNLADALLTQQKKEEAMVVINQILLLNPPNAEQYRRLLQQIQL